MTTGGVQGKRAGRAAYAGNAAPLTEEGVAAGLVAGDEEWLTAAYRLWGPRVDALARRALGDPRDAEDVTQQVFLAAWRNRTGYRPERGSPAGWLIGIARHKIADVLRARAGQHAANAAARQAQSAAACVACRAEETLDRVVVAQELAKLPAPQRRVLLLAFYRDLTYPQVAEATGLPLGTVKSHARRGMRRLRESLRGDLAEEGRAGPCGG